MSKDAKKEKIITFEHEAKGHVSFDNNGELKVTSIGNTKLTPNFVIKKVLLVKSLKFDLLSICQLCDLE